MFPLTNPKLILSLLGCVGLAITGVLLYTHITLQASTITSLEASLTLQTHNAELAQSASANNAQMYEQLSARNSKTLSELHQLQNNINVIKEADVKQETKTNEYIDNLDKESFESKCYNMVVPSGSN